MSQKYLVFSCKCSRCLLENTCFCPDVVSGLHMWKERVKQLSHHKPCPHDMTVSSYSHANWNWRNVETVIRMKCTNEADRGLQKTKIAPFVCGDWTRRTRTVFFFKLCAVCAELSLLLCLPSLMMNMKCGLWSVKMQHRSDGWPRAAPLLVTAGSPLKPLPLIKHVPAKQPFHCRHWLHEPALCHPSLVCSYMLRSSSVKVILQCMCVHMVYV